MDQQRRTCRGSAITGATAAACRQTAWQNGPRPWRSTSPTRLLERGNVTASGARIQAHLRRAPPRSRRRQRLDGLATRGVPHGPVLDWGCHDDVAIRAVS